MLLKPTRTNAPTGANIAALYARAEVVSAGDSRIVLQKPRDRRFGGRQRCAGPAQPTRQQRHFSKTLTSSLRTNLDRQRSDEPETVMATL